MHFTVKTLFDFSVNEKTCNRQVMRCMLMTHTHPWRVETVTLKDGYT